MERFTLKKVTKNEWRQLYIVLDQDFPRFERIPWPLLKNGLRRKILTAYFLTDGDAIYGYAIWQKAFRFDYQHLLYFGVLAQYRKQGIGSDFLQLLVKKAKQGILLEVEDPQAAKNRAEQSECQRRIKFYEQNGFTLYSNFSFTNFGFQMRVMSNTKLPQSIDLTYYRALYDQAYGLPLGRVALKKSKMHVMS